MAKVVLENVHKNYGAPEDAVKGASFTVEDFSLDRLRQIDRNDLELRLDKYKKMLNF